MSEDASETKSETAQRKLSGPGSALDRVEESFKTTMKEMNEKVSKIKRKVITNKEVQRVTQQFETFMQKRENPDFLVKLDEFSFSFGVLSTFLTFSLLFYPNVNVLATWVTIINVILITLRFLEYKSKKWHYYFFDYCYFVNIGSWIYLWAFPRNLPFFYMICMNAFCPLLNYFIIFKPKLIFQSREAVTSFFMHYTPGLLFWILRFFNYNRAGRFVSTEEIEESLSDWRSQFRVFGLGLGFYAAWVLFYYLFIFKIREKRIKDRNYPTLFSYTVEDFKRFNSLILYFGDKWAPISYMLLHLLQGFLGCLMSMLLINFRLVALVCLAFYILFPIWNSSVYYFEYFSKDYNSKLEARASEIKEKRMKRSSSTGTSNLKRQNSREQQFIQLKTLADMKIATCAASPMGLSDISGDAVKDRLKNGRKEASQSQERNAKAKSGKQKQALKNK